jgi:hypothetical protein
MMRGKMAFLMALGMLGLSVLGLASCAGHTMRVRKRTAHFVFSSQSANRAYIAAVAGILEGGYPAVCAYVGHEPAGPVEVEVYDNLSRALDFPRPVNGFAGNGKIQLTSPDGSLESPEYLLKVPLHELVHVVFNDANKGFSARWMSEGLAEYLADGPRTAPEREAGIRLAVDRGLPGGLLALDRSFSTGQRETTLIAYSLAHGFVKYLAGRFGRDFVARLVAGGMDFGRVLGQAAESLYAAYVAGLARP